MKQSIKHIKRLLILIIGIPVLLLGIILIPLPGPGLVVCGFGLFILSWEFEFAERWLIKSKDRLETIWDEAYAKYKDRLDRIDKMK